MNDDELREWLVEAHRTDAPPPFSKLWRASPVSRRHRRRLPLVLGSVAAAAAAATAAALLLLAFLPHHRSSVSQLEPLAYQAPLDFLLKTPGSELLVASPRLGTKGKWP